MDDDLHQIKGRQNTTKPIIIEDNVWIGADCKIFKNVFIGEGSVIAAGSIVTKTMPPNTLCGGVPYKVIKKNIKWL